ncbi:MAG TPA: nicotinate phosphoribosyltransferase [Streptosporangiaceae bacterium]
MTNSADSKSSLPDGGPSTALLTDHYELTMLQGALHSGAAGRRTIFEVFARHLPHGRRYGVVAGTGRLLDALERFRFDAADLDFLRASDIVDDVTLRYLESYRFTGNIWGYAEGDCYFPGSPIIVVEGTFAEAVILETITLSILNHDCAIASAASRMVNAAGDRPLIEMGSRRTHEMAAVASARAAYLAGFATTSNLQAHRQYGVPSAGTSAHAFTLVHDNERHAFATQLETLGHGTTLLVDTFDVPRAVRAAVDLAGPDLGSVRIDSGDLPVVAHQVRALLDELGAKHTRITLTGDLDEYSIAALATAPVDGYGVGTSVVIGSGAPTASLVYKLVARSLGPAGSADAALRPVAKRSVGKPGVGGRKWAQRHRDEHGIALSEQIRLSPPDPGPGDRPLLVPLVMGGEIVGREPLAVARERHRRALDELPLQARQLSRGDPAIPTIFQNGS